MGGVLAIGASIAALNNDSSPAWAQDETAISLPPVDVSTRLLRAPNRHPRRSGAPAAAPAGPATPGENKPVPAAAPSGGGSTPPWGGIVTGTIITGASSTAVTATDIERSPGQTVQDILAREPGIQVTSLFGSINGAQTTVDMRGFGATATANTLVLVNGRRLNDIDLQGVDFSAIPRESIERIEITRGNSGAVLYGDGAVGGVINIVTKNGVDVPASARIQGSAGSYDYFEGSASFNGSAGPLAATGFADTIFSQGYRQNNQLHQNEALGNIRWNDGQGTSGYLDLSGDTQRLGLPGGRLVSPTLNLLAIDPRGATTPFNFADQQGVSATAGVTRELDPGTELIVDGGVRQKNQQAAFFCTGCPDFDEGVTATLTTASLTPRISSQQNLGGMSGKLLAGIDLYDATFGSDRSLNLGDPPYHRYDLGQLTAGGYFMETIGISPTTDFAFGGRVQENITTARDHFNMAAPGGIFATPQGLPLDQSETQYAAHIGFEHRLNDAFAVFGRAARSFRLPTVDERVGVAPFGVPTNFALKTQTSHDIEGGIRANVGTLSVQSSVYEMQLENELFFSPVTFTNVNLDPTERRGWENIATWQATETLRFKAGLAYTRSVFREGPFAGNDVPLVSRWTGSTGVSWSIYEKDLVFDATARFFGPKRMDNDSANLQVEIPGQTLVDLRLGGARDHFFWSISVQNAFNVHYFEYAASAINFLTELPLVGTYSAYPLPGRTFLAKAGMTW
jgi:iron complex outermembrane receptor protein